MNEQTQTLLGVGLALAGLVAFLFPGLAAGLAALFGGRRADPRPEPPDVTPEPLPDADTLDRVAVFATLDRLRAWFESEHNAAGAAAMTDAARALIDAPERPEKPATPNAFALNPRAEV